MVDLFIPIILGTVRKGRMSEPIAHFMHGQVQQCSSVTTELIDIQSLPIPLDDAGPEAKIPGFSATLDRADGLILVVPEYNHGVPGLLKHVLDLNYKEYLHKAVGVSMTFTGAKTATTIPWGKSKPWAKSVPPCWRVTQMPTPP